MSTARLEFAIERQPDPVSCGATCLHAVYRYYGGAPALPDLVGEIPQLGGGGTLGVILGCHALARGYQVDLYTYNLTLFDPTWFADPGTDWAANLEAQARYKTSARLREASAHYLQFVRGGGRFHFEDLRADLIRRYLRRGIPIIAGLSSTFLYRDCRVIANTLTSDSIRGIPEGHFMVLCGYDAERREVRVADPYHPNPLGNQSVYPLPMDRVLNAILLGILTYDGNLLVIRPRSDARLTRSHP